MWWCDVTDKSIVNVKGKQHCSNDYHLLIHPIGHDEHAAVPTGTSFPEKIHLRCV
jgi:hypothetical protein